MPTVRHNPAAIAVATLIYFFLGAAWFTTFMNPWLAGVGRTMAELKASGVPPWLGYVVALVMAVILATAISWIIQATGPQTAARGAIDRCGSMAGICLHHMGHGICLRSPRHSILAINTGYPLVGMLIMGLVIGAWRAKPRAS